MSEQTQARISQGCKNHPPLQAKVFCRDCNAPLCSMCCKFVDGKFLCEECVAANVARKLELSANVPSGSIRPGAIPRNAGGSIRLDPYNAFPVAADALTEAQGSVRPAARSGKTALPGLPARPGSGSVPLGSVRFEHQASAHPATGVPNVVPGQKISPARGSQVPERPSLRNATAGRKYSCKHHPGVEASVKCDLCGTLFCAECVKETRKRMLCPGCASPCGRSGLIAQRPAETIQFSERVPGAFLSPLLAERKYLLLLAPGALWMGFVLHWGAGLAVAFYVVMWLMKITRRAAQNNEDQSTHPSLGDPVNDMVKPFFMTLLTLFVLLLPILIYLPLGQPELMRKSLEYAGLSAGSGGGAQAHDPEHLSQYITTHAYADRFITWAFVAAAALLPLALGMLGLFGRADVLSPPTLATALTRLASYYALPLALIAAGAIPTIYVAGVLKEFSGVFGVLCMVLTTYFSIVAFRIFGDVYLTHKSLFEFYGRPLVNR